MAKKLSLLYPGKIDIDANNQFGTFKNRTSDALKDGTPYEKGWASDVWGFLAHILGLASVVPSGAEENETNSQYYDALEGLVGRRGVDFETSSDLVINVQSSTTVDMDMKRLKLLDSNFVPKYLDNVNVTYNMPADLEVGTSEKPSTNYGLWIDSDSNLRLVPDLESLTDSTVAGFLADSAATLLTDLVKAGDRVYNLTTLQQTTVSADAVSNVQVAVTDDIFTSGDSYKIVKLSPEGLGENRERIGAALNNGSSDFDDSTYSQIQEEKSYSEAAGDFTSSGTSWTPTIYDVYIRQINDWTGRGTWKYNFNLEGVRGSGSNNMDVTTTGITFASGYTQPVTVNAAANAIGDMSGFAADGTAVLNMDAGTSTTFFNASGDVRLLKKPTFHN